MKLGKVKRNLIGLGCGALLCAALSANVAFAVTNGSGSFNLGPSASNKSDSSAVKKTTSATTSAYANVTQYQNKSSENFLYLRTRKATQEVPCSGKVKVYGAGGPATELKYTGYDSKDKYYLRGMLEDKATGYGLMVGSWTP